MNVQPQYVQSLADEYGIGLIYAGDVSPDETPDWHWDIHQMYGSADRCELHDETCSPDGVLWQTDDMGSPYVCTNHFFPVEDSGCQFLEVAA